MGKERKRRNTTKKDKPNIFELLKPYKVMVVLLVIFALISNAANLVIPKIISHGIDSYTAGNYDLKTILTEFVVAALVMPGLGRGDPTGVGWERSQQGAVGMLLLPGPQGWDQPELLLPPQLSGFSGMGVEAGHGQNRLGIEAFAEAAQHLQLLHDPLSIERATHLSQGDVGGGEQRVQAPAALR